jgi:hypothetical protein
MKLKNKILKDKITTIINFLVYMGIIMILGHKQLMIKHTFKIILININKIIKTSNIFKMKKCNFNYNKNNISIKINIIKNP